MAPALIAWLSVLVAGSAFGAPPAVERGKTVYQINCVTCHGAKGDGKGPAAAATHPKPRNFTSEPFKYGSSPEEIFMTVTRGVAGTAMPSWKDLPEEDRRAVIQYVLKFRKKGR